jgi:hypothetical protein
MSPFEFPAPRIGRRPILLQIRTGFAGPSRRPIRRVRVTVDPEKF